MTVALVFLTPTDFFQDTKFMSHFPKNSLSKKKKKTKKKTSVP